MTSLLDTATHYILDAKVTAFPSVVAAVLAYAGSTAWFLLLVGFDIAYLVEETEHERHTTQVVRGLMEGCAGGKAAAGLLARFRPPPSAADATPPSPAAPASLLPSLPPPPPLLLLYAHRGALYGCVQYDVEPSTFSCVANGQSMERW